MGPTLKRTLLLAVGTVVSLSVLYLAFSCLVGAALMWLLPHNAYAPLVPRPAVPITIGAIGVSALALGIVSVRLFSRWTRL